MSFKDNRFRQNSRSSAPYWKCRAYCRHNRKNCITIKMTITKEPRQGTVTIPVNVYVSGRCTHPDGVDNSDDDDGHLLPNRRQLSGGVRAATVAKLRQSRQSATEYYYATVANMNDEEVTAGQTAACQTPAVFRQAVYEKRRSEHLHENIIHELQIQKSTLLCSMPGNTLPGHIHSIGVDPFHVLFFSQGQLERYVEACKQDGGCTVHLDATGSIMCNMSGQKRPMYYCLLLEENSLPVCEILTTRHTYESIQARLMTFNYYVRVVNNNKLVKPAYVVTDYSFALINASVKCFNDEPLSRYLRRCHDYLTVKRTGETIRSTTFLVICHAHIINNVVRRLNSVESDRHKRKLVVMLFTALAHTTSLEAASALYDAIHIALCSRKQNVVVNAVTQRLSSLLLGQDGDGTAHGYTSDQQQDIDDRNEDDNWSADDVRTLRQQSPFTQYFRQALTTVVDNAEDGALECDALDNDWYTLAGFRVIEDYVHLFPMWSAALQCNPGRLASDYNGSRSCENVVNRSNAAVETHFREVKLHRFAGLLPVRPREFIDLELIYITGKLRASSFPRTVRETPVSARRQFDNVEERWERRKSRGPGRPHRLATYSHPATAAKIIEALGKPSSRGRGRGRGRGSRLHAQQSLPNRHPLPVLASANTTVPPATVPNVCDGNYLVIVIICTFSVTRNKINSLQLVYITSRLRQRQRETEGHGPPCDSCGSRHDGKTSQACRHGSAWRSEDRAWLKENIQHTVAYYKRDKC